MNAKEPTAFQPPRPMKTIKRLGLGALAVVLSVNGTTCISEQADDLRTKGVPPSVRLEWRRAAVRDSTDAAGIQHQAEPPLPA